MSIVTCLYTHRHGEDIWAFESMAVAHWHICTVVLTDELLAEALTEKDRRARVRALIDAGKYSDAIEAFNDGQMNSADRDNFDFYENELITAPAETMLVPKCPHCGQDDINEMEIMETFTAYHPIRGLSGGAAQLMVENALGTTSPSEHFDDGANDYRVHCRGCHHEGTPKAFGLPEQWDWV